MRYQVIELDYLPAINLVNGAGSTRGTMQKLEIFGHPVNEVIFKDTLDSLM